MNSWVNKWIGGRMDGWTNEWINGWLNIYDLIDWLMILDTCDIFAKFEIICYCKCWFILTTQKVMFS